MVQPSQDFALHSLLSVLISAMWQQNHPAYNGTGQARFLFCTRIFPGCYLQNLFFKSSQLFCCWSSSNRNSFINQTDHQCAGQRESS